MRSKLLVTIFLMMASPAVTYAQGNMEPFKVGTFEIYKNNPNDTAPAELRTEIFLPLK